MRSTISIFLILVYGTTLFLPLNPVIHYVIHKKYYKEMLCVKRYIPGNCCEGKCQLKKEISASEDNSRSNSTIPLPKNQNEVFSVFFLIGKGIISSMIFISDSNIEYINKSVKKIFIAIITPPPRQ